MKGKEKRAKAGKSQKVKEERKLTKVPKLKKLNKLNMEKDMDKGPTERLSKHFYYSIGFRFLVAFAIPIIAMICIGILSYQKASSGIIKSFKDNGYQSLLMTEDYSSFGLNSVQSTAFQYIVDDSFQKYFSNYYKNEIVQEASVMKTINKTILAKQISDEFISSIHFISVNKNMISTSVISDDDYESVYQSFLDSPEGATLAANTKASFWFGNSELFDTITDNDDVAIRYCRGFQTGNGCIIIDVSKERIISMLSQLDFGENSLIGFLTDDGKQIIISSGEEVDDTISLTDTSFYQDAKEQSMAEDGIMSGTMDVEFNGEPQLFVYAIMEESRTMVCAVIPEENMLSKVQGIKIITIISILISIVVVAVIGSVMTVDLQTIIRYMNKKLYQVSEGNLTTRMNKKRNDEFSALLNGTNHMIENMRNLILQVKSHMDLVVDSAQNVKSASNEFMQSSETIKLAVDEIQLGIGEQADDAASCLGSMDALSGKVDFINGEATNVSSIAKDTMQSIDNGMSAIHVLDEKAKATSQVTSKMKQSIRVLEDKSAKISSISATINDIAEETNLLSLNASIEAARAGIYGKGFSVIADEIRKLADQSAGAVSEISKLIYDIQQQTGNTADVVDEVEKIVTEQGASVKATETSFETMSKHVGQFVATMNAILEQISMIQKAKAEALYSMEHISAVSQQTKSSSLEITEITNRQLEEVKELGMLSEKLDHDARELMEITSRFIVDQQENSIS